MWRWQSVSERVWTRTSACPRSDGRCSGACAWRPGSSSSSLSQSLSFLLSSGQPVQCTWILTGQFVCLCVITLQLYLCRHIKEIYIIHFVTYIQGFARNNLFLPYFASLLCGIAGGLGTLPRAIDEGPLYMICACVCVDVCVLTLCRWLL